ncbi:hypothetical protein GYMLUDRAFT_51603 [Collybiopsis luxurians FD-317 M1]|nr:hypothetical protein GYMLUDRAFT_51603 [Collybiopsis luxurians FD-317 M1]
MNLKEHIAFNGLAPTKYSEAKVDAINEFNHYMCIHFLCLALCNNYWKTRQIWIPDYSSWYYKWKNLWDRTENQIKNEDTKENIAPPSTTSTKRCKDSQSVNSSNDSSLIKCV